MRPSKVFLRSARCLAILVAACAGSGCIAFNMGDPDKQTYEFRFGKAKPDKQDLLGCETVEVGPSLSRKSADDEYVVDVAVARALGLDKVVSIPAGAKTISVSRELANRHGVSSSTSRRPPSGEELGRIDIGLAGDVLVRQQTGDVFHEVTITKQNRMSFGFVPGAAEYFLRPKESLKPMVGWTKRGGRYEKELRSSSAMELYGGLLATPFALVCTPFVGKYECHSHHWKETVPGRLSILARLSPSDREKADINVRSTKNAWLGEAAHCPWFGFHKYQTIVIGPTMPGRTDRREETECRSVKVPGPYKIEFCIPSLGYRKVQTVEAGKTEETFLLPPVEEDVEVESKIRFLPAEASNETVFDPDARSVFDAARDKTFSRSVRLFASASAGGFAPGGVTTQVVVQVAPQGSPFRMEKRKSKREGWTVYRVSILDEGKTAFEVNKLAKPEILRELREEFASKNPDIDTNAIHAHASYVTAPDDARVLVYSGLAFATQPVDRMEYDDETHRGTIRLRVSDHLDLKAARAWARENIEGIVSEKNVLLEPGKSLPPDAKYKSLDEVLENGILTVHFEARN